MVKTDAGLLLSSAKLKEIQARLKQLGLPTEGRKKDLQSRLEEYLAEAEQQVNPASATATPLVPGKPIFASPFSPRRRKHHSRHAHHMFLRKMVNLVIAIEFITMVVIKGFPPGMTPEEATFQGLFLRLVQPDFYWSFCYFYSFFLFAPLLVAIFVNFEGAKMFSVVSFACVRVAIYYLLSDYTLMTVAFSFLPNKLFLTLNVLLVGSGVWAEMSARP